MNISNRLKEMKFSSVRKLSSYATKAKQNNKKIIHLNIGQPDVETPSCFYNALTEYRPDVLSYEASQGSANLINSFIRYYKGINVDLTSKDILVTNGGSEALLFALMAVCEPNDEVLIPEPFYTNYNSFTDISMVKIAPFNTSVENGFRLPTMEYIESKITPKTKAILYSNPGNPTGVVYTKEEILMLGEIAKKHNLWIISDEVYREFIYDADTAFFSPIYDESLRDRVILIDSVSKRYSACGARIGCLVSKNAELMTQVSKLGQSRLASPSVEQFASSFLINTPKEYFIKVNEEYKKRRDLLVDGLSAIEGVTCSKPEGAFYLMAKLPVENAEDFSKWLLTDFEVDNTSVMLAPGNGFYGTYGLGKDEVRIAYCLNCTDLATAIDIIKQGLIAYNKTK